VVTLRHRNVAGSRANDFGSVESEVLGAREPADGSGDAECHIRGRSTRGHLVEYGDFECRTASRLPIVEKLIETLGDQLCFAFRNFPLTQMHPHAEHAAERGGRRRARRTRRVLGNALTLFEKSGRAGRRRSSELRRGIGLDTAASRGRCKPQFVAAYKGFLSGVRTA